MITHFLKGWFGKRSRSEMNFICNTRMWKKYSTVWKAENYECQKWKWFDDQLKNEEWNLTFIPSANGTTQSSTACKISTGIAEFDKYSCVLNVIPSSLRGSMMKYSKPIICLKNYVKRKHKIEKFWPLFR